MAGAPPWRNSASQASFSTVPHSWERDGARPAALAVPPEGDESRARPRETAGEDPLTGTSAKCRPCLDRSQRSTEAVREDEGDFIPHSAGRRLVCFNRG